RCDGENPDGNSGQELTGQVLMPVHRQRPSRASETPDDRGSARRFAQCNVAFWHIPAQCIGRADNLLEGHCPKAHPKLVFPFRRASLFDDLHLVFAASRRSRRASSAVCAAPQSKAATLKANSFIFPFGSLVRV